MDFGPVQSIYWRPMEVDIERNGIDTIQEQSSKDETVAHNSAYLLRNLYTNTNEIKICSGEGKKKWSRLIWRSVGKVEDSL